MDWAGKRVVMRPGCIRGAKDLDEKRESDSITGVALGEPIFVEQDWLPVKWDDRDDPDFCKLGCLAVLAKAVVESEKMTPEAFAEAVRKYRVNGGKALWDDEAAIAEWKADRKRLEEATALVVRAQEVQDHKVEYASTFCWWCGGLKHEMTKQHETYCNAAAFLASLAPSESETA